MARKAAAARKKKIAVDFEDPDSVLRAMAKELDAPVGDLEIEEDQGHSSFGVGTVYRIELGSKEYFVVENDEVVEQLALELVKQDLEQEPELFNKSFIESHINLDRLRSDLQSDVESSNYDYFNEIGDERLLEEAPQWVDSMDKYTEEDEDGEVTITDQDGLVEEAAEAKTAEDLKDPMAYLEDIYGDEAAAKAIEIAGIDVNAAAEEAVSADGPGHFLSSYDGHLYDVQGTDLVYWRHN